MPETKSVPGTAEFGFPAAGHPPKSRVVLVVGNFDGVHLGHQRLLQAAADEARGLEAEVLALTFEPHPRAQDPESRALLTPLNHRRDLLFRHGAHRLLVVPFNRHLSSLAALDFMDLVSSHFQLAGWVAGPRLSVGRGADGGLTFAEAYAATAAIPLRIEPEVLLGTQPVSSGRARQALAAADLDTVRRLLGRRFSVRGLVIRGEGRGGQLGFPTANLGLHQLQVLPPDGVYAMRLAVAGAAPMPAVGSIGTKPHFGSQPLTFEVHCLEDPGNLYGRPVEVELEAKLREQRAFPSDADLVGQMERDAAQAAATLRDQRD